MPMIFFRSLIPSFPHRWTGLLIADCEFPEGHYFYNIHNLLCFLIGLRFLHPCAVIFVWSARWTIGSARFVFFLNHNVPRWMIWIRFSTVFEVRKKTDLNFSLWSFNCFPTTGVSDSQFICSGLGGCESHNIIWQRLNILVWHICLIASRSQLSAPSAVEWPPPKLTTTASFLLLRFFSPFFQLYSKKVYLRY